MMRKAIPAGDCVVDNLPLFDRETGSPPDLMLVWNQMPASPPALDIVLHLHGYSPAAAAMNVATEKRPLSGLDFGDPDLAPGMSAARTRPTLGLLPRGRYFGGHTGFGYNFPILAEPHGWPTLMADAAKAFKAKTALRRMPRPGRRVLTAHSGGGAWLMPVARYFVPQELHVYDALYFPAPELAVWVQKAIAADAAALKASPHMSPAFYMSHWGHALRVFYLAGSGTEAASLEVAAAITAALAVSGHGSVLSPWYQVSAVTIEHALIPRRLGWLMLADAGSAASG